ncbi:MAG: rhomboid family intramembrane serine protease [Crocinitomicaceae bacterium]|nr:rhomboid family intramembrane serine protease [Crocinitomicaceae bacterium]
MFGALFRNLPSVVKNLVIINGLFFLATIVLQRPQIDLDLHQLLGMYYPSSPNFRPYQIATHFFMHANFMHIFFNMFALIVFGAHLERMWGPKRFLIFYFATAMGAALLHFAVEGVEIYQITGEIFPHADYAYWVITDHVNGMGYIEIEPRSLQPIGRYYASPTLGASGAVYGLIAAFAMLFPNTQLMLLFPPIPIKAKWLALALAALALYQGYANAAGDSVAHFAHLGGMLFGFIIVKIWQRNKNHFY